MDAHSDKPKEKNNPFAPPPCACQAKPAGQQKEKPVTVNKWRYFSIGLAALAVWVMAYLAAPPLAGYLAETLASDNASLKAAVEFFFYDTAKILLLLVLMVYGIAWLRAGLHVDKVRGYLAGKGRKTGYALGAGFGAITPFCSCSSIPLFLGFTTARIPLGISMAFLITSPIINEVAVVLLWGLLGWKFTLIYVLVGMAAGIVGGFIMDSLRAERWLQPFLLEQAQQGTGLPRPLMAGQAPPPGLGERHAFAWDESVKIFRKVWLWVLIGVGLGAALHGYVPQDWFAEHLGAGQWWSVPLAVALGIPLYTNVTGIVPVMESLLLKGLPLGTTLAFCMSTVAVSLPEILMLKQVMRWRLLALFVGILLVFFTLAGWLFNLLPFGII